MTKREAALILAVPTTANSQKVRVSSVCTMSVQVCSLQTAFDISREKVYLVK